MNTIDINCDLGEGIGNETQLMPLISTCNIACGAHAGSVEEIDRVLELAKAHKVKIGAHPSYPDRENFGRLRMEISSKQLSESLRNQLTFFKERVKLKDLEINHIKPHGALYNEIVVDRDLAQVVLEVIKELFNNIKIFVPCNSEIEKLAIEQGISVVYEAFADRNYNDDLTLVSRKMPKAVLTKPEDVLEHLTFMQKGFVRTITGLKKNIKADTFCVHGDHANTYKILKELHKNFAIG